MLLGEYEHTIDDKNRLTLPAKFRQAFADGIVVTRGLDGCLYAFTRGDWKMPPIRAAIDWTSKLLVKPNWLIRWPLLEISSTQRALDCLRYCCSSGRCPATPPRRR